MAQKEAKNGIKIEKELRVVSSIKFLIKLFEKKIKKIIDIFKKYFSSYPLDMLIALLVVSVIFIVTEFYYNRYFFDISSMALLLTLIVIFFYTKYTFEMLRGQDFVSASLSFEQNLQITSSNQSIIVNILNQSKYSIEAHCQADFYLFGEKLNYNGFYNNEWPLYFQPKSGIRGHIDLPQIYQQKDFKFEELNKKEYKVTPYPPGRSRFEIIIDFSYRRTDSFGKFIHNPKSYYVIDLNDNIVITMDNGLLQK